MVGMQNLLCTMLNCGSADLELLDRMGYDWDEILDQLDWPFDFNQLLRAVVDVGIIYIKDAMWDRIIELTAIQNKRKLDEDEEEEMKALGCLDPDQDIKGFFNHRDTHVWLEQNGPVYRKYLSSALDSFEENVGFFLTGGEEN